MEGSGERWGGEQRDGSDSRRWSREREGEKENRETEEGRKKGLEERDSLAQFQSANNS